MKASIIIVRRPQKKVIVESEIDNKFAETRQNPSSKPVTRSIFYLADIKSQISPQNIPKSVPINYNLANITPKIL